MIRSTRHPRRRRPTCRRALLGLPLLALLAAAPLAPGMVPAPVTAVRAADCPLPPQLCPPSSPDPTPRSTSTPRAPTPQPSADATATPTAEATPPAAATSTPRPSPSAHGTATPAAGTASAPVVAPPGTSPSPSPSVAPPLSGAQPPPGDATPVRTLGTVAPSHAAMSAWQVLFGVLGALAVVALLVLRAQRQRRRAALHARFNRMRVERGLTALTPRQIDFLGPRRRFFD
jgi:hypothetical protein